MHNRINLTMISVNGSATFVHKPSHSLYCPIKPTDFHTWQVNLNAKLQQIFTMTTIQAHVRSAFYAYFFSVLCPWKGKKANSNCVIIVCHTCNLFGLTLVETSFLKDNCKMSPMLVECNATKSNKNTHTHTHNFSVHTRFVAQNFFPCTTYKIEQVSNYTQTDLPLRFSRLSSVRFSHVVCVDDITVRSLRCYHRNVCAINRLIDITILFSFCRSFYLVVDKIPCVGNTHTHNEVTNRAMIS